MGLYIIRIKPDREIKQVRISSGAYEGKILVDAFHKYTHNKVEREGEKKLVTGF